MILQCLRQYMHPEEGQWGAGGIGSWDRNRHIFNICKYLSAVSVVVFDALQGSVRSGDHFNVSELLKPNFAILDETDSGLDVDALRVVSEGVNRIKEQNGFGVLLITHYTRILNYIKPDFVHVFVAGKIAEQGGPELAERLEAEGYDRYLKV